MCMDTHKKCLILYLSEYWDFSGLLSTANVYMDENFMWASVGKTTVSVRYVKNEAENPSTIKKVSHFCTL